ncbi:hypothetical protein VAPA_1c44370 [Variovorax paradoxus B4]|uniref:Transmembrane protein n=1 Tax=Variovorax paradoxus B4 TaxID=1246301 RepID=T1XHA8_VARPD|nr:hypothetical protein [Variovorax paradoxus]AGU51510.1 hypothetical protein VAPA_1c44370 [Variovorax paradoxus B4]
MIQKTLGWSIVVALVAAAGWFGRVVPFAEQWPMFEALRTTAAIIFAVIGAWMAIIYPERLKLSMRNPDQAEQGNSSGMGQLFTPVVNSTAILCVILILGAVAPVAKKYPLPFDPSLARGISYALLVALTIWQLWTVILSLVPASLIKSYADREDATTRVRNGMFAIAGRLKADVKDAGGGEVPTVPSKHTPERDA